MVGDEDREGVARGQATQAFGGHGTDTGFDSAAEALEDLEMRNALI